jgi:hypothetical protein
MVKESSGLQLSKKDKKQIILAFFFSKVGNQQIFYRMASS